MGHNMSVTNKTIIFDQIHPKRWKKGEDRLTLHENIKLPFYLFFNFDRKLYCNFLLQT